MRNFDVFVDHIVVKWRKEKKVLLEKFELGGLVNRQYGDQAEDNIVERIKNIKPTYHPKKTTGSQTPADVFAVARRENYWHIMLIQVKSSENKDNIYELNDEDKKAFKIFGNFVKDEISKSEILKDYNKKALLISTGYAGVHRLNLKSGIRYLLKKRICFTIFRMNAREVNYEKAKKNIIKSHTLK